MLSSHAAAARKRPAGGVVKREGQNGAVKRPAAAAKNPKREFLTVAKKPAGKSHIPDPTLVDPYGRNYADFVGELFEEWNDAKNYTESFTDTGADGKNLSFERENFGR